MTDKIESIDPQIDIVIGEGPHWDQKNQLLHWVDIEGKKLLSTNLDTHQTNYYDMPEMIGHAIPSQLKGFIVSLQSGIYRFIPENQQLELLQKTESDKPNNRPNDGKCDPLGRLWIGTMDLDLKEKAAGLYRMDSERKVTPMLSDLTLANGLAWDESKSVFYFIDTMAGVVFSFSYDLERGDIANQKIVIEFDKQFGLPDGMCIDQEGMLWVAGFGGGNIMRFDPQNGKLLERITVPAPNTTSICFAGQNLNELVITTANLLLTDEQRRDFPKSGQLFKYTCDTPGMPGSATCF